MKKSIGVIGLGWLGKDLALELSKQDFVVWGTRTEADPKAETKTLAWNEGEGLSSELKTQLKNTGLLIITVPPSPFSEESIKQAFQSLAQSLPKDSKIIYTSSIGIYQKTGEEVDENSDKLVKGKLKIAEEVLMANRKDQLCILRLGGLIGEDRNPAPYLVKKDMNDNPDAPVQLIHKQDIIAIVKQIIERDYFGEILNLVHPDRPSRKDYYSYMAAQLKLPSPRFSNKNNSDFSVVKTNKLHRDFKEHKFVGLMNA